MTGRLPNAAQAFVDLAKITEYLLAPDHPDAEGKAEYFSGLGFSVDAPEALVQFLIAHADLGVLAETIPTSRGMKYVVEGPIACPDGRVASLRTVWFVRHGEDFPRLVTAYPLRVKR